MMFVSPWFLLSCGLPHHESKMKTEFAVVNLSKSTRPQRPLAIGGARRKSPGGDVSSFQSSSQIMFGWSMTNDSRMLQFVIQTHFAWIFLLLTFGGWVRLLSPKFMINYSIGIPNGFHCRPILFPTSSRLELQYHLEGPWHNCYIKRWFSSWSALSISQETHTSSGQEPCEFGHPP